MLTRTMTAAALAAAMATPAFAQQSKPSPMAPTIQTQQNAQGSTMDTHATIPQRAGFVQKQQASEWRGSKLIGASVYGPDNKSIGEINDVLVSDTGNVSAVVIGVGGFLGVGEKNVALPFSALDVTRKADSSANNKITVSYTKDQLKDAPKFAYYDSGAQTTGERSGNHPMTNTSK
jgi:sporulation protein YlmC with PRC-barrel domain